jgi:hypothetical protein
VAREVVTTVTVTCDGCGGPDADPYTETNSKGTQVEIDLDKACHDAHEELRQKAQEIIAAARQQADEVLLPIKTLINEKGMPVAKQQKKKAKTNAGRYEPNDGPRVCLLCDVTHDSDHMMREHLRTAHGLSGSFVEAYGTLCPVDGEPFERIGHHIRQAHPELGIRHYSEAFAVMQKKGDPTGVVAGQIAALQKLAKAA